MVKRYENVGVYTLGFSTTAYGDVTTTETLKFTSRPEVHEVKNSLAITDKYRVYSGLINFTFNFTPNTKDMYDNQSDYSVRWRGNDWRIDSAIESNDRQYVTFLCYRNEPSTKV